jgi:YVTN family beta-propeller protein
MNTKTGIVYVTRSEAGQLISINGSTHSVTNVMDLGAGVAGIAINNKNIIYVTNPHSNSLDVINGSTNELMTKLDVGKAPSRVAVNPITNLVYVVNSLSDNISVINGSTNKIIETVLTGDRPSGISIDLQNNLIFIINFNSDDLSVINGTTNEVIGYIKTGKGPSSIDFDPVTKKIFVSNYWSNEVSIIDENDLLVTLSNNRNTLQNTNWISSPGWDLSSRSVNINQYSFSKENNTLTIAFKAIMSDDSYLSYSNNLKNEGIKVHNLPFIAVVFDKYGPSNPKDLLMTIGFTDGTIKNIHLNDATSFNGHELAMIDNRQNQDKIYGNITIYAESFHPATQTGELNYRIDFHSIKFLHIPMVPP